MLQWLKFRGQQKSQIHDHKQKPSSMVEIKYMFNTSIKVPLSTRWKRYNMISKTHKNSPFVWLHVMISSQAQNRGVYEQIKIKLSISQLKLIHNTLMNDDNDITFAF